MAYEQVAYNIPGVVAAADLSAKQHTFVVIDSSGKVAANTASGGEVDGILQDKPDAADKACSVATAGVSKCVAGSGGVTAGDLIMSDTAGKGILATSTNFYRGRALTSAAEDELFSIHLGIMGTV